MPLPTPPRQWLTDLVRERGRSLSTVMGVAWGTFGVVGLLAFGRGLEELMRVRGQGMGAGIVVVWPQRTTLPFSGLPEGRPLSMTVDDVRALRNEVPAIEVACPEFTATEELQRGQDIFRARISGVTAEYGALRNMRPSAGGRFLNRRDVDEERRVAFLGDRVATHLFGADGAVGRRVVLRGMPFTVVGVLAPKLQDSDYEGTDDGRVCIPATTHARIFGNRFVTDFVFRAWAPDRVDEATREMYAVLGRRLRFDPGDRDALNVWDTTQTDRIRSYSFLAMNLMMGLGGALTLLVGGIGVGNLMFLVVQRRTAEIGVLMALGARPRQVLGEVLLQALLVVGVGGALGFAGAVALAEIVAASPLVESLGRPTISPAAGLGTVALLAVVGLAAGWVPARRAANLDPVAALAEAP